MFTEQRDKFALNRRLADSMRVRPALIADGSTGIVIHHGNNLVVLTHDEALTLANTIVDRCEA